ncbi:MAG: helix-hairpin-helix domain-containing protein, partial [Anaerolineales bacterium]
LQDLEQETSPEEIDEIAQAEIPDWLAGLDEEEVGEEAVSEEPISRKPEAEYIAEETEPTEISETIDELQPETTPDELPGETIPQDEGEDWLQDLDASTLETEVEIEGEFELESADMPQWLRDIAEETPTAMEKGIASEKDLDDLDIDREDAPEWLEDMAEEVQVTEGVQEPSITDDDEEGLPFSLDDEDAALAWLEGLAAKQGVEEEELITQPEERPEISSEEKTELEPILSEDIEIVEEELFAPSLDRDQTSEGEQELPAWLEDFMEEAAQEGEEVESEEIESLEEITSEKSTEEEMPAWLVDLDEQEYDVSDAIPDISESKEPIITEEPIETEPQPEHAELDEEPPVVEAEPDIKDKEPVPTIDSELPDWLIELADETPEKPEAVEPQEPEIDEQAEMPTKEAIEEPTYEIPTEELVSEEFPEWLIEKEEVPGVEAGEAETPADETEQVIEEEALYPISEIDKAKPSESIEIQPLQEDDFEFEEVEVEKEGDEILDEFETISTEPVFDEDRDWILEEEEEPEKEIEEIQAAEEEIKTPELVDLNTANEERLKTLPGVGPHLAQSIIAHRETYGPFIKLEDILNVAGVGPTHLEGFEGLGTVEPVEEIVAEKPLEDEYKIIHTRAHNNLSQGNVEKALEDYDHLLKSDYELEKIIKELSEATYQHPLDVALLQSLGDAYLRSDRLQDALETYNRAEELLR